MSYSVKKNAITLTRGDTLRCKLSINTSAGEQYSVQDGDSIRFAMKQEYNDKLPILVEKEIPTDSLELVLEPTDTASLEFRSYVYDIQLTKADGSVDTFIQGTLKITEEVG